LIAEELVLRKTHRNETRQGRTEEVMYDSSESKQIVWTAAYAHRATQHDALDFAFCQQGPQDPRIIKPGYPKSPSRPHG
jgi:hypothetical protein